MVCYNTVSEYWTEALNRAFSFGYRFIETGGDSDHSINKQTALFVPIGKLGNGEGWRPRSGVKMSYIAT